MADNMKNGLDTIAQAELEVTEILSLVPPEHRGLLFERVFQNFHPQKATCMLELGFALEWSRINVESGSGEMLNLVLAYENSDPRKNDVPQNAREWQVAQLTAATLIQWLATSVGTSFLQTAFKRGGGSMHYTLPIVED